MLMYLNHKAEIDLLVNNMNIVVSTQILIVNPQIQWSCRK